VAGLDEGNHVEADFALPHVEEERSYPDEGNQSPVRSLEDQAENHSELPGFRTATPSEESEKNDENDPPHRTHITDAAIMRQTLRNGQQPSMLTFGSYHAFGLIAEDGIPSIPPDTDQRDPPRRRTRQSKRKRTTRWEPPSPGEGERRGYVAAPGLFHAVASSTRESQSEAESDSGLYGTLPWVDHGACRRSAAE